MKSQVIITLFAYLLKVMVCDKHQTTNFTMNSTDSNKDMYVIHAMVYQVGILTNKTDDRHPNVTMGNQEALTLFRTNGSKIDLSSIPTPLLTNVTAQSVVQVAPKQVSPEYGTGGTPQIAWNDIQKLASLPKSTPNVQSENSTILKLVRRSLTSDAELKDTQKKLQSSAVLQELPIVQPRFVNFKNLPQIDLPDNKKMVKVVKGSAEIPQAASVQSIAIPSLVTLNNNLSDIPVPIPNTSVVHYAKVNTVIRKA